MLPRRLSSRLAVLALLAAVAVGGYFAWARRHPPEVAPADHAHPHAPSHTVRISPQARKNLQLVSAPLEPRTYWRTIDVPGMIIDRPGVSDRGIVAPVAGVIAKIHAYPGDAVAPRAPLFSIRLAGETLQTAQLELFKATREIENLKAQLHRLSSLAETGAIPEARLLEIQNQIRVTDATRLAERHALEMRGLAAERIDAAARGEFVNEITVEAPGEAELQGSPADTDQSPPSATAASDAIPKSAQASPVEAPAEESNASASAFRFELHDLQVELGQQVAAGELLATLADHRTLLVEGRGFSEDMPLVQAAVRNRWKVAIDFGSAAEGNWPSAPTPLPIRHVANTIDPASRTFAFYILLRNQWQAHAGTDHEGILWRFRPGERVRLRVPVEKLDNVFVVPQAAIAREGPEAFVFRQNGNQFDRRPAHVVYEDRRDVVLANDGSLQAGFYYAQNAAASLDRVLHAQQASGEPDVHVHADGTVHEAH